MTSTLSVTAGTAREARGSRRTPIAISNIETAKAASGSVCNCSKTASGSVWVRPCRFPANVIVAPNSPSARAHDRTSAAAICGPMSGKRDPSQHVPAGGAERRGRVLEPLVEPAQPGLEREHRERERDEGRGEDRGPGRERDLDAEPFVEPRPDDPGRRPNAASRADARHDRRHHERKDDEARRASSLGTAPRASTQASGNPSRTRWPARPSRRASESRSAVQGGLARQDLAEPRPRGPITRPRSGQRDEQRRPTAARTTKARRGSPPTRRGGTRSRRGSAARRRGHSRRSAARGRPPVDPVTTAIGYVAMTFTSSGISISVTWSATSGVTSVT